MSAGSFGIGIVVAIGVAFFLMYISGILIEGIEKQTSDMNETNISEFFEPYSAIGVIPFVVIVGIALTALGIALPNGYVEETEVAYYLDTDDIAVEPKTLKVRDARKILKIRFAKGEITKEEYTMRMSRL
jgi:uncharacterized membrane protein